MNDPDFIHSIVNDFKKSIEPSEFDRLFFRLKQNIDHVKQLAKPIQVAGGAVKKEDREMNLKPMIFNWLMDGFVGFSKDETRLLLSAIIGDQIMSDIEADPWGKGSPDLLSGK